MCPRTHRIVLDRVFDGIHLDSKIQIRYVETKDQLADILTKGSFTREEWNEPFQLTNVVTDITRSPFFWPINEEAAMSKRQIEEESLARGIFTLDHKVAKEVSGENSVSFTTNNSDAFHSSGLIPQISQVKPAALVVKNPKIRERLSRCTSQQEDSLDST